MTGDTNVRRNSSSRPCKSGWDLWPLSLPDSPVILFTNGIGDAVLNMPALRAITRALRGRSTLICDTGPQSFLFEELDLVRRVPVSSVPDARGRILPTDVILQIVSRCDLFISLAPWMSSTLRDLLRALQPSISLGFFLDYTVTVPRDYCKHSLDLAFDIARVIDPLCNVSSYVSSLKFPEDTWTWAKRLRQVLPVGSRVLAIHTDTAANKMWDSDRWQYVTAAFLRGHPEFYAFVVGVDLPQLDRGQYCDRIILCGGLKFDAACCLVSQSDIFLGVDSCMLHIADFARVPGVGLFGPTLAREFGFRLSPHVAIQAPGAMKNIEVEQVLAALECIVESPNHAGTWYI
jgi:hypothetical protein